jgi:hypothetical protein
MPTQNDLEEARNRRMELQRRAHALRQAVFLQQDPSKADPKLEMELEKVEKDLEAALIVEESTEKALREIAPVAMGTVKPKSAIRGVTRSGGELTESFGSDLTRLNEMGVTTRGAAKLGDESTGLDARYDVRMSPVPTGVYHLLEPTQFPLVVVDVTCSSLPRGKTTARVKVQAYLEGLSSNHVKTFELKKGETKSIPLLPSLLPDKTRFITEVQRATLHVIVEDLDGKTELHDSVTVTVLARNSGLNSVKDPKTGTITDLTPYYGAWVTPHAEPVLKLLRKAAEKTTDKTIMSYLTRKSSDVLDQARALFETLKEEQLVYVNSVIGFGVGDSYFSQRARLPRESLDQKSANCLDGTLLFASLLEAASLNSAIVLVPGHALVGWQNLERYGEDDPPESLMDNWTFLETTMIGGKHTFEAAMEFAGKQVDTYKDNREFRLLKLTELRLEGIYPME